MRYINIKRLFDIIFSFFLIIIFSPIFLIIIILLYLFDEGNVLFKQSRIGQRTFTIYKFRTLPSNTNDIPSEKLKDIRITLIGKLLRRTNLDELPQLINIFNGDMSFVGPRPCLKSQHKLLKLRKKYKINHLKPGLTGLAQINSYDNMPVEKKVFYDSIYKREISFLKDIKIILKTFAYLLKPPPKY